MIFNASFLPFQIPQAAWNMSVPVVEAAAPLIQCAARDNGILSFFNGPFDDTFRATRLEGKNVENTTSNIVYNADGSLYAIGTKTCIFVKDANTHETVHTLDAPETRHLYFSPKSTHLVVMTHDSDSPETIAIWSLDTRQAVVTFTEKGSTTNLKCQWTLDEKHFIRLTSNQIIVSHGNDIKNTIANIPIENVTTFRVSPLQKDNTTSCVATFVPAKKGKPANVSIYNLANLGAKNIRPTASKTFFKATEAQLKWNSLGSAVLCWTSNTTGALGDSYYDESFLYLLTADGSFDCVVPFESKHPIHDVCWAPRTYDFMTLQGEARSAKATVWSAKDCRAVKELGTGPWNSIRFSPSGRFVALAGFGNLAGKIEVWDKAKLIRLASTQDFGSPSVFEWCPDGRHFVVATVYPRLRVGNQFKIYKYDGSVVYSETVPSNLFTQLTVRPAPPNTFIDRPASPEVVERAKKLASQPASAQNAASAGSPDAASRPSRGYVPPHLRGQTRSSGDDMKAIHEAAMSGPRDILKEKKQQQQQTQQKFDKIPGHALSQPQSQNHNQQRSRAQHGQGQNQSQGQGRNTQNTNRQKSTTSTAGK